MLLCIVAVVAAFAASGHLRMREQRDAPPPEPVRVRLMQPSRPVATETVVGSVLDTMGFLLVGAEVRAGQARSRTDADGRFALEVARCAAVDLRVDSQGYRGSIVRAAPLAGEPVVVALEPAAPWDAAAGAIGAGAGDGEQDGAGALLPADLFGEGLACDDRGRPLEGAFVVVAETGAMTRADAAGRFRVPLARGEVATLLLHHPGSAAGLAGRAAPFAAPDRRGLAPLPDLVGAPAAAIRGTVRAADGQPLQGVPLQIVAGGVVRAVASGEGGAFRLGGLLPGCCEVRAFAFRGALGERLAVELSAAITDCEVHLRAADSRRLQVVTESGEPVPRAVVATSVGGLRRGVTRGDDDGWVHVRAGAPDARYEVRRGSDYRELRVVAAATGDDRLVVAAP